LKQSCCLLNKRIYALWIDFFWARKLIRLSSLGMQFLIDVSVDPDLFALALFMALPDLNKSPTHI